MVGAFRTYPDDYKPSDSDSSSYQSVPMDKIKDFGVHANRYYQMEVSYFKSNLDNNLLELLWSKYWVNTLSANPLLATKGYMTSSLHDLSSKIDGVESSLSHGARSQYFASSKKKEESQLSKISKDSTKLTMEQIQGLMSQVIKNALFNGTFSTQEKMK
jgi:COP9 signalosome complex subunit 5